MRERNRHGKEFKFKAALEAIKGEKKIAQIASEFRVHLNVMSVWKRQLLERGADVFETGRTANQQERQEGAERLVNTIGHHPSSTPSLILRRPS